MPIYEDTNSDIIAFESGGEILSKLIRHFVRGDPQQHYGFQFFRFTDGEKFLTLRGSDIGLEDPSLWFRFGLQRGYLPDGNFSRLLKSGAPVITVYGFTDLENTEQVAKDIIYKKPIHNVIQHELVHYFDNKRNPKMLNQTNKAETGTNAYFNNPEEFNAYYTNLAHPLLHFIRAMRSGEINDDETKRFAKALDIGKDFMENVKMMIDRAAGQSGGAVKKFYQTLNKRNRRALLKRLYGLHQQVLQYL